MYNLELAADSAVPVDGRWLVVYFSAFLFWLFGTLKLGLRDQKTCYRVVSGDLLCKAVCMVIFLILPTTIVQPDVSGPGVGNGMLRLLYSLDQPTDLFPSIHVYWTWYLFRWFARDKDRAAWKKALLFIYSLLVFYSTLATRQHYLVDVAGGVAVAEFGLFAEKKWNTGRVFERLDEKLLKE